MPRNFAVSNSSSTVTSTAQAFASPTGVSGGAAGQAADLVQIFLGVCGRGATEEDLELLVAQLGPYVIQGVNDFAILAAPGLTPEATAAFLNKFVAGLRVICPAAGDDIAGAILYLGQPPVCLAQYRAQFLAYQAAGSVGVFQLKVRWPWDASEIKEPPNADAGRHNLPVV